MVWSSKRNQGAFGATGWGGGVSLLLALLRMFICVCGDVGREVIRLTHFQGQSQGQGPYLLLTPYTHIYMESGRPHLPTQRDYVILVSYMTVRLAVKVCTCIAALCVSGFLQLQQ
jgi:hypothetical protein